MLTIKFYTLVISMIMFILLSKTHSKNHQIIQKSNQQIKIRVNTPIFINQPKFNFNNVYFTSVFRKKDDLPDSPVERQVEGCSMTHSQISFQQRDSLELKNFRKRPHIVYDFQDIKNAQDVLDIIHFKDRIFAMLEDGKMLIIETIIDPEYTDKQSVKFGTQISINSNQKHLQPGYFFIVENQLFFVNGNNFFHIKTQPKNQKIVDILDYMSILGFTNVAVLKNGHIAIAYQQKGVFIYKIASSIDNQGVQSWSLSTVQQIKKFFTNAEFQTFFLQDITYSPQNDQLYVLEEIKGLYNIKIKYDQSSISAQEPNFLFSQSKCDLMGMARSQIFISCKNVVKRLTFSSTGDKLLFQFPFQRPQIKIKQIFIHYSQETQSFGKQEPIVFLVGSNSFRTIHLKTMSKYYQNHQLDRLYVFGKVFITANQNKLVIGHYSIIPSKIFCNIPIKPGFENSPSPIGTYPVRFTTMAQCNQQYFKINNLTVPLYQKDDFCVYLIDAQITVWQPGQVNVSIIALISMGVLGIALICLFRYIYYKLKYKLAERNSYPQLEEQK